MEGEVQIDEQRWDKNRNKKEKEGGRKKTKQDNREQNITVNTVNTVWSNAATKYSSKMNKKTPS